MRHPSFALGAVSCLLLVACGPAELSTEPDAGPPDGNASDGGEGDAAAGGTDTFIAACPEPVDGWGRPVEVLTQADLQCADGRCVVPAGSYGGALSFVAANTYVLAGQVEVGGGTPGCTGRLDIEPGTRIIPGSRPSRSSLVILPHSRIYAEGTPSRPIVFTSAEPDPRPGIWGGLVLAGRAPVNCGGRGLECSGEAEYGLYGGTDRNDDSGVLRYIRIEYAGARINSDVFNGLSLEGVGAGTVVDHIHVHRVADDGVEVFGGTVNLSHIVVSGSADDAIDWTFGWQGSLQYAVIQQYAEDADNGLEGDNNGDDNTATPRAQPMLSHLTLIGSPRSTQSDVGIMLRAGTGAQIWNAVVVGFEHAGLDIDDDETFRHAQNQPGNLAVAHSVFCNAQNVQEDSGEAFTVESFVLDGASFGSVNNEALDFESGCNLGFSGQLFSEDSLDAVPAVGSPLATGGAVPNDPFFEPASYRGAVEPGTAEPWWAWTRFP